MMKRAAVGLLSLVSSALPASAGFDASDWNDGRAEVAVYESQRLVEGEPVDFRETLSVTREELRLDSLVKADKPKEQKIQRVFKLNVVQKFDGPNFPYSFLTSVFLRTDNPSAVMKLTVGAQDAVGNTFKLFTNPAGAAATLLWHSYFDGEADKSVQIAIEPTDLFEDALPVSLRALKLKSGFQQKARLWESLATVHGVEPKPVLATVRVVEEETVRCHAGAIPCWKVSVDREGGPSDTYWIEKADPRILVKMDAADGRKRALYSRARWSFWDKRLPRPNVLN